MVGGHWGDVILTAPMLQDQRPAKALSYCEIAKLSRELRRREGDQRVTARGGCWPARDQAASRRCSVSAAVFSSSHALEQPATPYEGEGK